MHDRNSDIPVGEWANNMPTLTLDQHIDLTPGVAGGKPRIAGHRITVQDVVVWHERMGKSVDEIATEYNLTLADVHAALAYYFDHRAIIDQSILAGQELAIALKNRLPSKVSKRLLEQALSSDVD